MKIHYIYAHPQETSFNAFLKAQALAAIKEANHQLELSDLYAMNFNPVASWKDFEMETAKNQYFQAQQMAYQQHSLSSDIQKEIEKIRWADHLFFQFPLWWFSMPAILKGWFDRVLVKGFAYDSGKIFQTGLLKGKTASLIVTTQSPESAYQPDGTHQATIESFLKPIHHTLHFAGIETLKPFVTYAAMDVEDDRKLAIADQLKLFIRTL